ncbi:MAG: hypothetical protein ACOH16_00130 [Propionibacteriaceae bacterium]
MPNLVKGQCLYIDDKEFEFDIPCADPKAAVKVIIARSYCLGAP